MSVGPAGVTGPFGVVGSPGVVAGGDRELAGRKDRAGLLRLIDLGDQHGDRLAWNGRRDRKLRGGDELIR